jgi:hypothetical protein
MMETSVRVLRQKHPDTLTSMANLASMLKLKRKMSLAVEAFGGNIPKELLSWSEYCDLVRELFTS